MRGSVSLSSLPKTKFASMILLFLSILYIISPIDFIPDIIPVVGWIDDFIVFIVGVLPISLSMLRGK